MIRKPCRCRAVLRYAHLAPREIHHLIDRIAPDSAPLRVIEGTDETGSATSASDDQHPPQRQNRGCYTGGYNDRSHRKTARSTVLRAVLE